MSRPRIRVLHNLARSGGTLIARCLGAMDSVVLLSEIHPLGVDFYDPAVQARDWYGIVTDADIHSLPRGQDYFVEAIKLISSKAEDAGLSLVLRDWSHLDFTGVPFVNPTWQSKLASDLEPHFDVLRYSTTRHPLDQWLSLSKQMSVLGQVHLESYLSGVRRFTRMATETGFTRYEDVGVDPESAIKSIADSLAIPFDRGFLERWSSNTKVTGDVTGTRGGKTIRPLPRRTMPADLADRLLGNADYQAICNESGYDSDA